MEEKVENFVEVVASITMSRSLYFPISEGMTREKLLEKAKQEFKTPQEIMSKFKKFLAQFGVKINDKELKLLDWNIDELEFSTDYTAE